MAGNSKRQGATRNTGAKKARTVGSGGNRRQALEGKGPTPKATERTGHVAKRKADQAARAEEKRRGRSPRPRRREGDSEVVAGRNPVAEALAAGLPATALIVQRSIDSDPRVKQAMLTAVSIGLPMREASRAHLDELTGGLSHQGIALEVAEFEYSDLEDLLAVGTDRRPGLLVALDGVTDSRNMGAIARSAAAFGGTGLVIPSRRSATVTAAAWKTSAGAFARLPVAMVTNLTRSIEAAQKAGFLVAGLAASGTTEIRDANFEREPVMLVVGGEGKGLGQLVSQRCDLLVSIHISDEVESLNASVAASIALHEVSAARR